jgi:hypothetical protein
LQVIDLKTINKHYHVYQLDLEGQQIEIMEGDGEDFPAASHWIISSAELHGLWEYLTYDSTIEESVKL